MPSKNPNSKRKREKQTTEPVPSELPSRFKVEKNNNRIAPSTSRQAATVGEDSSVAFTRRRAQALGKEPIYAQLESERSLRNKTRKLAAEKSEKAKAMERRHSGDGNQRGPSVDEDEEHGGNIALRGLLRRLGAGFEDVIPGMLGGGSAQLKSILAMLREPDDAQHITGLTELCEYISISTEDALISLPVEQVVPLLVGFLSHEHNPDVMLLAARALTFLADVFPPSCGSIIRHGAVPAFCARLLTIEYIDLAEQSLQALEKLSHDHAGSLLRNGALVAVLSYVDFFQTGVQRVAVATAANICRGLTTEYVDAVSTAAPILINLLRYSDAKIVNSACLALTRIASAFSNSSAHMEMLVGYGLINSIVEMVAVNEVGGITSQLSASTFYGLIKLLATCAASSHVVAESLLQAGISQTLRNLLATSPLLSTTGASPGNSLRSGDQLQDLVELASHLLPEVPDASIAVLAEQQSPLSEILIAKQEEDNTSGLADYLCSNPEATDGVSNDLFPVMLRVYVAGVTPQVKSKSLVVLGKILYHTSSDTLRFLLSDLPVSSLISRLLQSADASTAAQGMQMAEVLMVKLPDVFEKYFLKEGVVHAMEELTLAAPADQRSVEGRMTRARSSADKSSRPERQSDKTPTGSALRSSLALHARRFCQRYFTTNEGKPIGCHTEGVETLQEICARLPDPAAVQDLFSALTVTGDNAVSTFEILTSGMLHTLREYLRGENLAKSAADSDAFQWQLLERLAEFARIALPAGSGGSPPLVQVLSKLQAVLTATERFQVMISDISGVPSYSFLPSAYFGGRGSLPQSGGGASGSLSAGLSVLSNPFKIRLVRAAGERSLRDYSTNVVLIEPLASLSQIEEFLWGRVQLPRGSQTDTTDSARDGENRQAAPVRGGGVPESGEEPSKGRPIPAPGRRLTRAQARAAAEAEVAAQGGDDEFPMSKDGDRQPEPEECPVEPPATETEDADDPYFNEEQDMEEEEEDYVEGDDDEFDDEEDMLDAAAMHVHDMHLAEDLRAASGHHRFGRSPESPTNNRESVARPSSYASAAARAGPRLAFYINGQMLDPTTTIFQAVRSSMVPHGAGSSSQAAPTGSTNLGARLWGDVHTLTYRPYEAAKRDNALSTAAEPMDVEEQEVKDKRNRPNGLAGSPLMELVIESAIVADSAVQLQDPPVDCVNVLTLISTLEALNRLSPHLLAAVEGRHGRIRSVHEPPPGHVPREAFINGRLGSKISQQLKDVISVCGGALPPWCKALASDARFLFPFETRRRLFYCTSFGLGRALLYLQQSHAADHGVEATSDRDGGSLRIGRIQRQKVRISRSRILESALRVFENYAGAKSQLEVEFFGEAGSGLGPTLEFYTLLSHELQRRSLGLWRNEGNGNHATPGEAEKGADSVLDVSNVARTISSPGPLDGEVIMHRDTDNGRLPGEDRDQARVDGDLVRSSMGLFPKPLAPSSRKVGKQRNASSRTVVDHFRLLGRVTAKALQDCRLLDLPLSPVFYRLALGRRVDLYDVRAVDPFLGASLEKLHAAECAFRASGKPATVDGCAIEDLCLTFTLPGDPTYELRCGGANESVTNDNLREYIDAVVDATLGSGVAQQMEGFKSGFSAIFPLSCLAPFYEDEIEAMLCGTGRECWTPESLAAVIKFDHGYTSSSAPIVALLEVLVELDAADQRRFLRFVTGSPRLPPGGLGALQPRLTVVRKASVATGIELGTSVQSDGVVGSLGGEIGSRGPADGDLPSVMTCANYLKLPPYSSKEVLRERLLFAIREGQGSFDLS